MAKIVFNFKYGDKKSTNGRQNSRQDNRSGNVSNGNAASSSNGLRGRTLPAPNRRSAGRNNVARDMNFNGNSSTGNNGRPALCPPGTFRVDDPNCILSSCSPIEIKWKGRNVRCPTRRVCYPHPGPGRSAHTHTQSKI